MDFKCKNIKFELVFNKSIGIGRFAYYRINEYYYYFNPSTQNILNLETKTFIANYYSMF